VSLMCLLGLFLGGLQSTWLSASDTWTHIESPIVMPKSARWLPRCRWRPYTINNNKTDWNSSEWCI